MPPNTVAIFAHPPILWCGCLRSSEGKEQDSGRRGDDEVMQPFALLNEAVGKIVDICTPSA